MKSQVQADARRLQSVFFGRMTVQFPDVDFSPVKTKNMPVPAQPSPAPAVAARKVEHVESGGVKSGSEAPTTRWSSARPPPKHTTVPTPEVSVKEKVVSVEKKSKRTVKDKSKDPKKNGKLATSENVEEDSRGGILHPVDLVIHKKKRGGRERVASKLNSRLFYASRSPEEIREPSRNSGNSVSSPRPVGTRRSQPLDRSLTASPEAGEKAGMQESKVGKRTALTPKLKRSWADGSKRRPAQT